MADTNVWRIKDGIGVTASAASMHGWEAPRALVMPAGTTVALTPGAWLLDLGQGDWQGRPLYRLAGGQVVTLDKHLSPVVAEIVEDGQVVSAMRAFQPLGEMVREALGLEMELVDHRLHPFQLIKCPLCGGTEFVSLDLASAWCRRCNAQFSVQHTAGDPGFTVHCTWDDVSLTATHYLLPRHTGLSLVMTLKDSGDPLDLWPDEGCCHGCLEDHVAQTGPEHVLREGLHLCQVGTLYGWTLVGQANQASQAGRSDTLFVDDHLWPDPERQKSAEVLRGMVYNDHRTLPPLAALAEGEQYLLTDWQARGNPQRPLLHPLWTVVRQVEGEGVEPSFRTARADLCPSCGLPVTRAQFRALGETSDGYPHNRQCVEWWSELGWRP